MLDLSVVLIDTVTGGVSPVDPMVLGSERLRNAIMPPCRAAGKGKKGCYRYLYRISMVNAGLTLLQVVKLGGSDFWHL
jgi:hypothetical protein